MGCWGMGLNQSDEYGEAYDRFMKRYNEGADVQTICEELLADYLKEFDQEDPILHDVYFALAKAGWMCCSPSEEILERVHRIIESGANLAFYRERGAGEKDLALRQKKLDAFWESLQTPREKPIKRHPAPRERELPNLEAGDVLAYKTQGGRRVLVVLERVEWPRFFEPQLFCCVLQKTWIQVNMPALDPLQEKLGLISSFAADEFLAPSTYRKIGKLEIPDHLYSKLYPSNWKGQILFFEGRKKDFHAEFAPKEELELEQLLNGKAPKGMSLYHRVSRVSFPGSGVLQIQL